MTRLALGLTFLGGIVCYLLTPLARSSELELGYGQWALSNHSSHWSRFALALSLQSTKRESYRLDYARENRFNQPDQVLGLTGAWPLSASWATDVQVRGMGSVFLPTGSLEAGMSKAWTSGWSGRLGLRAANYPDASGANIVSDTLSVMVENYFSDFRLAYTHYLVAYVFPIGSNQQASSHAIALQYFYADRASLAAYLSLGDELEYTGSASPLVIPVTGMSLVWQHPLSPTWLLRGSAERQQQGDLYNRAGINLELVRQL